jgi:hypothetical protein
MKMLIVDIRGGVAVALRDDGTFVKVPQRGNRIGQTIRENDRRTAARRFPRFIAACIAFTLLLGAAGAAAVELPYSYVTMDVNPSVQYTLNVFDRVISVEAVNDDAREIVETLNAEPVQLLRLADAIEKTIDQCRDSGYLYRDAEDYIVLSVAARSAGKTNNLSDALSGAEYGNGLISAEVVPTTITDMKQAGLQGTTPGKLRIIRRMQESTGDILDVEEWIDVPVREILGDSPPESADPPQDEQKNPPAAAQEDAGSRTSADAQEVPQDPWDGPPADDGVVPEPAAEGEDGEQPGQPPAGDMEPGHRPGEGGNQAPNNV